MQVTHEGDIKMQPHVEPRGRLLNFLSSDGPIIIVIPSHDKYPGILSIALRIAHNLFVYHKLDAEIWADEEAISRVVDSERTIGYIVSIGNAQENAFTKLQMKQVRTEFRLQDDDIYFRGRLLHSNGLGRYTRRSFLKNIINEKEGLIFTHPHPTQPSSMMLFMMGTNMNGLERVFRLFPLRTGVTAPDWMIIGEEADRVGSAGVLGAGCVR